MEKQKQTNKDVTPALSNTIKELKRTNIYFLSLSVIATTHDTGTGYR
jgi:hypothetical protein